MKKIRYLWNYAEMKQGIATIVIYIMILPLLVRTGLKLCKEIENVMNRL